MPTGVWVPGSDVAKTTEGTNQNKIEIQMP